uniref:L1 transposable element RRM domain-containing protein n=1 Tax=Latimeria chalumnae TaxID=7897 RepID=H3APF8_LATCH
KTESLHFADEERGTKKKKSMKKIQKKIANDYKIRKKQSTQLTANDTEVKQAVLALQQSQDRLGARLTEAERRISKVEDEGVEETQRLQRVEQQLAAAVNRIDDLENRSRRNNIRIVGFPEGVEGGNPRKFLQAVIPELLGLDKEVPLEIERAHRALGPRPAPSQRSRAFIIKLLRFPTRERILGAARVKGHVMWENQRISFFPDWSRDLQLKRQLFWEIRKILRDRKIKFGLFYPAVLKITHNGETLAFTDPGEAKKYLAGSVELGNNPTTSR